MSATFTGGTLPSGRFVQFRDKFITSDGHLCLMIELWPSEAYYKARPDEPRAAHDWLHLVPVNDAGARVNVDPQSNLTPGLVAILERTLGPDGSGEVNVFRGHSRRPDDPYGWLSHPHVQALEVTP